MFFLEFSKKYVYWNIWNEIYGKIIKYKIEYSLGMEILNYSGCY